MGSWSVNCGISNIAITSGNKCVILPIKKNMSESRSWLPATLPIFGIYNDYGGLEDIEKDDNTKLIEEHFGVTIDEFVEFLVDGKFTYDRKEAKQIKNKIEDKDRLSEVEEWRFMWIDRQVYDFMTKNFDKHDKGYMDYGTSTMLKLFGFELKEKSDKFKNYDPKRFNQLWQKGDVKFFSDGNTLLAPGASYVYHFGKGDSSSLETYFEVPEEYQYLKNLSKQEAWRILSPKEAKKELGYILGDRYSYNFDEDDFLEELRENKLIQAGVEKIKKILPKKNKALYKQYYDDLEKFGDKLVELINVNKNLYPMSGEFRPHVLYLTPQCGEYEQHQIFLEKFAEINKSYIHKYEEDEE